jgi:hypothetical protein
VKLEILDIVDYFDDSRSQVLVGGYSYHPAEPFISLIYPLVPDPVRKKKQAWISPLIVWSKAWSFRDSPCKGEFHFCEYSETPGFPDQ